MIILSIQAILYDAASSHKATERGTHSLEGFGYSL